MFKKVLIANRGVVAVRVARTLRRMGIPWAAVYSEADAGHPYVREADEAWFIGPAAARESYLNREALLDAATRAGCDAVHPGYGFLAEDPKFAEAVERAGMRFIGPSPRHIEAMGNKVKARELMAGAGVPVLPASGPVAPFEADLSRYVATVGLPMLVKAAAGGGGIGMQRVSDAALLEKTVDKTRQLSERAFGDGTVYLERYLEESRHVEFQMIGDGRGNVRNIFERDCSIQRRHQKVVEEAPAPATDRDALAETGRLLADALGGWNYDSLGTVEMLMDRDGRHYFLEANTRLQVEHGVTEAVTGLDLVEAQIRIAADATLDECLPQEIALSGHAVEFRIYAEDPVSFFPSTGTLQRFELPAAEGVSVETHLVEGAVVTPYYDPMLALVIVTGCDRSDALARGQRMLKACVVEGIKTNIPFLLRLLGDDTFHAVGHHTAYAERLSKSVT